MSGLISRRSFLKTAATGGALVSSASKAHAQRKKYKRKSPSSVELIEVGMITCEGYTHADGWAINMNPPVEEYNGIFWPRLSGVVMTMVWDPDYEAAKKFAEKYDIKAVKNYYDMLDKVDAVIQPDYHTTGWNPQLTKPYLEAGMPVLMDRPMALSIREAKEIIERSKKYNAPILVPSSDERMLETYKAQRKLELKLNEGAKITGVMAFEPCNEYPAHGTHSIYALHSILEPNVVAANLIADKWWDWDSKGGLMSWIVKGNGKNPDYYVTIRMGMEFDTNGWFMISTTKGRIFSEHDHAGDRFTRQRNMFLTPILELARMVETGKMPQSHEQIMAKTITLLTGFYSQQEKNGNMVRCDEVPEDWRAPEVEPNRIPEEVFN